MKIVNLQRNASQYQFATPMALTVVVVYFKVACLLIRQATQQHIVRYLPFKRLNPL